MPTAANLNLYRKWKSCVGWHRDDEPLFGECGDAKLIVSVSFGNAAVSRWRRQSCPDDEGHLCWLGHGDILVKDGQCQDEFLHCTGSGRDQERINVTFRWIKQHVSSSPFLKARMACCLPTCARGSSVPDTGNLGFGGFGAFMFLFSALCILGVPALLVYPQLCTRLWSLWCASCWARPLGVLRWEHYLCDLWRANVAAHNTATHFFLLFVSSCMETFSGLRSNGCNACMVYWTRGRRGGGRGGGHFGEFAGKSTVRPLFLLFGFFCLVKILGFWGLILWLLWVGRAGHPGPTHLLQRVGIRVFNVGGWLTHGDLALEVGVDFLAVVEHRMIPARVRSEWARLRRKGLASIWAPACQESSHVGNAGFGVISMIRCSSCFAYICHRPVLEFL